MFMAYYAGIGSRRTPPEILAIMEELASVLAEKGYILRSGGALGADSAFEQGCKKVKGKMQIFIPKKGYKGNPSPYYTVSQEAIDYTEKFHPGWRYLDDFSKSLMGRNAYQILGEDLKTPSGFVVCWTPDGCTGPHNRSKKTGGTGQAISIAFENKVPVYNLSIPEHLYKIKNMIEKHRNVPHLNNEVNSVSEKTENIQQKETDIKNKTKVANHFKLS